MIVIKMLASYIVHYVYTYALLYMIFPFWILKSNFNNSVA
jgi:hypothetical protein